eukprot:Opistho-1_new@3411
MVDAHFLHAKTRYAYHMTPTEVYEGDSDGDSDSYSVDSDSYGYVYPDRTETKIAALSECDEPYAGVFLRKVKEGRDMNPAMWTREEWAANDALDCAVVQEPVRTNGRRQGRTSLR